MKKPLEHLRIDDILTVIDNLRKMLIEWPQSNEMFFINNVSMLMLLEEHFEEYMNERDAT